MCVDVSFLMRVRLPRAPFQTHLRNSKIHASDPSCWSPTVIIALGCERGVPFYGGFGAKAESGNANLLIKIELSNHALATPSHRTIVKSNASSGE